MGAIFVKDVKGDYHILNPRHISDIVVSKPSVVVVYYILDNRKVITQKLKVRTIRTVITSVNKLLMDVNERNMIFGLGDDGKVMLLKDILNVVGGADGD